MTVDTLPRRPPPTSPDAGTVPTGAPSRTAPARERAASGYPASERDTDTDTDADAMALGATMYVPAMHPAIRSVVSGERYPALRSVVLCLEDALHPDDVELGLGRLRTLLGHIVREPGLPLGASVSTGGGMAGRTAGGTGRAARDVPRAGPRLFVRPRGLDMARRIAGFAGVARIEGFVVPKITAADVAPWWHLVSGTPLRLMPTLESPWVFDPLALGEFVAALGEQDRGRLVALRVGGNDLLSTMRLRRTRGATLHEGPLAWGFSQIMCQLGSRGYPLTAPVFDVLDDPDTLARECRRDAAFGFVGKTAVHPDQIPVIEGAFAVTAEELAFAREALAPDADAVSRRSGRMLEPAVHGAWARRTVARAAAYGTVP